ncbi:MAG: ACGX-repeat peptide [Clostridiaceae bacterium]|nr:ACGX-repeat peptide [Clostridiaceae bacterium]
MALLNLFAWNKGEATSSSTACGASDKPEEQPSACGADDKPEEKPTACGAACGASDE